MGNMRFKVGDRVRIKSLDWYYDNRNRIDEVTCGNTRFIPAMVKYCEGIVTISFVLPTLEVYHIKEDGGTFNWTDEMIEGLAEEETKPTLSKNAKLVSERFAEDVNVSEFKPHQDEIMKLLLQGALNIPEGYIFKDENGNVINATKIVLEDKKKDVNLTQEQINTMVYDSCVLFCKHCGCGIPRETCISLGTCKDHDEYRAAIRTHLMEKKKKEYPKTYEECCKVLNIVIRDLDILDNMLDTTEIVYCKNRDRLLNSFQKLLVCRDAYWKIAGEEMGLGKPWEPDWNDGCYVIITNGDGLIERDIQFGINAILAFPTEEMRDAFYENFKSEIESCKELL